MLPFPFDESFQAMQPLVVVGDTVLVMSLDPSADWVLQTAAGVKHRLGPIGCLESLWRNALQRFLPSITAVMQQEVPRRVAELATSPLAYFIAYLEPTFRERDFSEASYLPQRPVAPEMTGDWSAEVSAVSKTIPLPELVSPGVWVCGRIWKLREQSPRAGCWQIVTPHRCYGLTGDFSLVATLIANWRRDVSRHISQVATRLAARAGSDEGTSRLATAGHEVASLGYVERGDLLFLPGPPPRLGHFVPVHYNHTLGRRVHRDLAMTAPLTLPLPAYPCRSGLAVYERSAKGWSPASLPHGLCLGPDPPAHPQESPGVGLASLLRWAAQRIAENGAFHSSDNADAAGEYTYGYNY